jgi:lysophospholipase L1-like esterase
MVARSLVSTGNNARLKAAIAKARSGRKVTLAYVGGSITEGFNASGADKSWARLARDAFRDLFAGGDDSLVGYLNAGMAGTPSTLGMIRYERDVLDRLETKPDVVFVEFAVNDGDDPTGGAAFESLVRGILEADNEPAVVLVFSVFQSRWNLEDRLAPVGTGYGLPMVSVKKAVVPALESGALTEAEFFSDIYHPTDAGHRLMADCVANLFKAVDAEAPCAKDAEPPKEPVIGYRFAGIRMIDAKNVPRGVKVSPGAFKGTDRSIGTFNREKPEPTFPANWHKAPGKKGGEFTMKITCRNLVVVHKKSQAGRSFGMAEAYVDGVLVNALDGEPSNGWNNPWTSVLVDDAVAKPHVVTIRMEDDSADKAFTILAFGYTE